MGKLFSRKISKHQAAHDYPAAFEAAIKLYLELNVREECQDMSHVARLRARIQKITDTIQKATMEFVNSDGLRPMRKQFPGDLSNVPEIFMPDETRHERRLRHKQEFITGMRQKND